jgi:twinkle protein
MDIKNFVEEVLKDFKLAGLEYKIKKCPYCGKEDYKFYLNSITGLFHCKHGSCDEKGSFPKLLHKFNIKTSFKQNNKYKTTEKVLNLTEKEQEEFTKLTDKQLEWFNKRGLSEDSLKYANVCNRKNAIVFPYLQENELKMIKYRDYSFDKNYKKKVWQQEGGTPVLLGIDKINFDNPVIICEGELDYLSFIESGVYNVVSLPLGTSNMDWISNNWEYLEKIKSFYICMDNDIAGEKAEKEIIHRLGITKLKKIDLGTYNDINDVLVLEGKEKIIELVEFPKDYQIDGIYKAETIQISGIETEYIKTFKDLDLVLGGFRNGEVTVWTGEPGSGKSTILNQVMIFALMQNRKVSIFSGELSKEEIIKWLSIQILGTGYCDSYFHEAKQKHYYKLKKEGKEKIDKILQDNFYLLEGQNGVMKDFEIMEKINITVKKYGVSHIVIDNLMQLDMTEGKDRNEAQKEFMKKIVNFANNTGVHIHLVAHPKKPYKGEKPSMYDIHGASEIPNLAYNIIRAKRIYENEKESFFESLGDNFDGVLMVQKNRIFGDLGNVGLKFDYKTKRFYTNEEEKNKNYDFLEEKEKKEDLQEILELFGGVLVE